MSLLLLVSINSLVIQINVLLYLLVFVLNLKCFLEDLIFYIPSRYHYQFNLGVTLFIWIQITIWLVTFFLLIIAKFFVTIDTCKFRQ